MIILWSKSGLSFDFVNNTNDNPIIKIMVIMVMMIMIVRVIREMIVIAIVITTIWSKFGLIITWLVVWTPLKNMKVNWDDYSQYMEQIKKCSKPPTSHIIHTTTAWSQVFRIWSLVQCDVHLQSWGAGTRRQGKEEWSHNTGRLMKVMCGYAWIILHIFNIVWLYICLILELVP